MTSKNRINNILAIDDNEILVHSVQRHLKRADYLVDVAYDGAMGRDMMLAAHKMGKQYDMVITDIIMPNMDGQTFSKWLHATYPDIALLVVSSFSSPEMIGEVVRPGRDGYLRKPLRPAEIMQMIVRIEAGTS